MGDIAEILRSAQERLNGIGPVLAQISDVPRVEYNQDYEWDGGDGLLEFDAAGAGTSELSGSMAGLNDLLIENPDLIESGEITPQVRAHLQGIADARGESLADIEEDYVRFTGLVDQGNIELKPSSIGYGSLGQLRFGYVVGDALDIDPAFGSLMSSSGGFTGPGDTALNIDGDGLGEEIASTFSRVDNEALSYHAATHDAMGFLNKHFDTGPGYRYAGSSGPVESIVLDGNSPLSGQLTGIDYWDNKLGNDPIGATTEAFGETGQEFGEAANEIGREGSEAGREIKGEFNEAGREIVQDVLNGDFNGAQNEVIEGGAEIIREAGEGGFEIIREGGEGAIEIVGEGLEGGLDIINEIDIPGIPGI